MRDELDWDQERIRQSVVGAATAGGALPLSGPHTAQDASAQQTCLSLVWAIMEGGAWWRPSEIQARIKQFHGKLYSESSITARFRDFRKAKFGGHLVECRQSWRRVKEPGGRVRRSREREYRISR